MVNKLHESNPRPPFFFLLSLSLSLSLPFTALLLLSFSLQSPVLSCNQPSPFFFLNHSDNVNAATAGQQAVLLPREALLKLSSAEMEKYVQTLKATRNLTHEEEKMLRKQRRYFANQSLNLNILIFEYVNIF